MSDIKYLNGKINSYPESKKTIYGFYGVNLCKFFDTEFELNNNMKDVDYELYTKIEVEYLGNIDNQKDVIRVTKENGDSTLYSAYDKDGYLQYNTNKNLKLGCIIWEYVNGNISALYSAFRIRGIKFENDVYLNNHDYGELIYKIKMTNE